MKSQMEEDGFLDFNPVYRYNVVGDDMEDKLKQEELQKLRERSYEYGLPAYLQHDLDTFKEALENGSNLLDCYWGELYGSINIAEINDGAITPEHADYLRQKYLWR